MRCATSPALCESSPARDLRASRRSSTPFVLRSTLPCVEGSLNAAKPARIFCFPMSAPSLDCAAVADCPACCSMWTRFGSHQNFVRRGLADAVGYRLERNRRGIDLLAGQRRAQFAKVRTLSELDRRQGSAGEVHSHIERVRVRVAVNDTVKD